MSGASKSPEVVMVDGDGGGDGDAGETAGVRGKTRRETRLEPNKEGNEKSNNSTEAPLWEKLAIEAARAVQKTPYKDITEAT